MTPQDTGLVASVRQRLLNISRERREDFQFILTRYAFERLLYRLSRSEYVDQFILKGALLFLVWSGEWYRPTRDMDLLSYGDGSAKNLQMIFKKICQANVDPDGITYKTDTVVVEEIREERDYQGQRVKLMAHLGKARVRLQIDIGFGDIITPEAIETDFPTLLEMPSPRILTYPRETMVAEKLHTMVDLGMQNSRMKDFYDVFVTARDFEFSGALLINAIRATFKRRRTGLPEKLPIALTDEFAGDQQKQTQWKAYLRRSGLQTTNELELVIGNLREFLALPLTAAAGSEPFNKLWKDGGPWKAP